MHRFVPWSLVLVGGLGTLSEEVLNRCINYRGEIVKSGERFTPQGSDLCTQCSCIDNKSSLCLSVLCSPPKDCKSYETLKDKCCEFLCHNRTDYATPDLDGVSTTNLGLRLVASTVTSLLILALLLFMVHRLRQRRLLLTIRRLRNARIGTDGPRVSRRLSVEDENVIGYFGACEELEFPLEEPPPPYTFYKLPEMSNSLPRGEPPPPYEVSIDPNNFIRRGPICYSPTSESSFTTSLQGSPMHCVFSRHRINTPGTIYPDGNSDTDSSSRSSQTSGHNDDTSTFDSHSDSSAQSSQDQEGNVIQSDARYEDLMGHKDERGGKLYLPSIPNYCGSEASSGCTIPKRLDINHNLAKKFNRYSYGDYTSYMRNGRELEKLQRRSLQELGATAGIHRPTTSISQNSSDTGRKFETSSSSIKNIIAPVHKKVLRDSLPKDSSKQVTNLAGSSSDESPRCLNGNRTKRKASNVKHSPMTLHSSLLQAPSTMQESPKSSSKPTEEICKALDNHLPSTCIGIAGIRQLEVNVPSRCPSDSEPQQTSLKSIQKVKAEDLSRRPRPRSCNVTDVGVQADTRKKRRSKDFENKSGKLQTKPLAAKQCNRQECATNTEPSGLERLRKCRSSTITFEDDKRTENFKVFDGIVSENYILEQCERIDHLQLVRSSSICSETGELRRHRLCVSPASQYENTESAKTGDDELQSPSGEAIVLREVNHVLDKKLNTPDPERESDV